MLTWKFVNSPGFETSSQYCLMKTLIKNDHKTTLN